MSILAKQGQTHAQKDQPPPSPTPLHAALNVEERGLLSVVSFLRQMVSDSGEQQQMIVVAIGEGKNTKYAVKWAVNHLLTEEYRCVFVHVALPRSVTDEVLGYKSTTRTPTETEAQQYFLPYRDFCALKGIKPEEVVSEGNQVSSALLDYISTTAVSDVVVGASTGYAITRKFRNASLGANLATMVPTSCTVHIIAKRKVWSQQPARLVPLPANDVMILPHPQTPQPDNLASSTIGDCSSLRSASSVTRCELIDYEDRLTNCKHSQEKGDRSIRTIGSSYQSESQSSSTVSTQWDGFYNEITHSPTTSMGSVNVPADNQSTSVDLDTSSCSSYSFGKVSYKTVDVDHICTKQKDLCSSSPSAFSPLSIEEPALAALQEQSAEKIAALAKLEVERQLREIAGGKAQRLEQYEVHKKAAQVKTTCDGVERRTVMDSNPENLVGCNRFSIDEIEVATDHFSESLRIGEGGYGPVFKGTLDEADVAIKILRPDISQGPKQFQKEVDILSCMRHPNMVRLVGACPEYGCLVYEYLENGSLEDRLFRKDNTPPIPWKLRFKIASEISSALLFLHQAKPEPMVHRDLKPANILLDDNYVAKISDVGLARLLPAPAADNVSNYRMTDAAGTFCYIDPEYQQTGLLGVKSDVYSLGVILLQIITAKPPMGITHLVQGAIESGSFLEILDPSVSDWPVDEALSFAKLALKCCELSKKDRPDLCSVVVPELNRIRDLWINTGEQLERRSGESLDSPRQLLPVKPVRSQRLGFRIIAKSRWKKFKHNWSLLAACTTSNKKQSVIANTKQVDFSCWSCSFSNRNLIRAVLEEMPSHEKA